jgi:ABC-type transport system involved in multi-copper enzyme maturation permease subunit
VDGRHFETLSARIGDTPVKALYLVRPLLRLNRWLLLLLLLWPYAMAALMLLGTGRPAADELLSLLKDECFYGIALVAFTGAYLLGNEQRSRRIITVLARAIHRWQYLLALLLAAWIPLALYLVGFVVSGSYMLHESRVPIQIVFDMALLQLVVGLWTGALSIFFSVFLPSILASIASGGTMAVLAYLSIAGPGRLLERAANSTVASAQILLPRDLALTLALSVIVFAAACALFARRDLNLSGD